MRGDLLSLVLVAPLVFRAPPVVSGRAARCARGRRPTREPSARRAFGPPNWWCCLWPYGCCGRRMARPPARLGGLTSLGAAPRSPPVPSRPSGALHTSGVFVADVARCVGSLSGQVPPPTCTAAKLAGSPGAFHTCGAWCAGVWFGALSWYPARPCHRPRAPQPGAAHVRCVWVSQASWPGGLKPRSPLLACACVGLKPSSPLRAGEVGQLKPSSPLRVRNGRFWCSIWGAEVSSVSSDPCWGVQLCCRFQHRHVSVSCARNLSPCSAGCGREREKVHPAPVLDAARRTRLAAVGVLHYMKPSGGASSAWHGSSDAIPPIDGGEAAA